MVIASFCLTTFRLRNICPNLSTGGTAGLTPDSTSWFSSTSSSKFRETGTARAVGRGWWILFAVVLIRTDVRSPTLICVRSKPVA